MLAKKDYEMVAWAIATTDCKMDLVEELCRRFKANNPKFNAYKFRLACKEPSVAR